MLYEWATRHKNAQVAVTVTLNPGEECQMIPFVLFFLETNQRKQLSIVEVAWGTQKKNFTDHKLTEAILWK